MFQLTMICALPACPETPRPRFSFHMGNRHRGESPGVTALRDPGIRRTLAFCSWSRCLLVQGPQGGVASPSEAYGVPSTQAVCVGCAELVFPLRGSPAPSPQGPGLLVLGGRLPYTAATRDDAASILWVFVPGLWNVNTPRQLASCRCE